MEKQVKQIEFALPMYAFYIGMCSLEHGILQTPLL